MSEENKLAAAKAMTAAEAAKQVKRPVTTGVKKGDDAAGNPIIEYTTKFVAVAADEVLNFKDFGTHVVVVTKDGQKFSSLDAKA